MYNCKCLMLGEISLWIQPVIPALDESPSAIHEEVLCLFSELHVHNIHRLLVLSKPVSFIGPSTWKSHDNCNKPTQKVLTLFSAVEGVRVNVLIMVGHKQLENSIWANLMCLSFWIIRYTNVCWIQWDVCWIQWVVNKYSTCCHKLLHSVSWMHQWYMPNLDAMLSCVSSCLKQNVQVQSITVVL